jgi:L-rhamnose mutarotase
MSTNIKRYCLALDLKSDPELIEAYKEHHRRVWPEILSSIRNSGILNMEIYHCADRLFMIMETGPDFSFDRKTAADLANPKVGEWETLMNTYQQVIPGTEPGVKWRLMDKIFAL